MKGKNWSTCGRVLFLLVPFVLFVGKVKAETYYVAPTGGSDSYAGTNINYPWATWAHALARANAGDTVYFRGGTWTPVINTFVNSIRIDPSIGVGHSGTAANPICFLNFPEEVPILDCRYIEPQYGTINSGIEITNAEYLKFKGLTIRNLYGRTNPILAIAVSATNCRNLTFENMTAHDISGRGFFYMSGAWESWENSDASLWPNQPDTLRFINCDAYNLCDSVSDNPGNAADGWWCAGYRQGYFSWEGCRAWNYADDGIDSYGSQTRRLNRCWVMGTKKYEVFDLEGNGIKMAGCRYQPAADEHKVIITNCIAAYCDGKTGETEIGSIGFYTNLYSGANGNYQQNCLLYNNTAYRCNTGFGDFVIAGSPRTSIFRNNVSYQSQSFGYGRDPLYEVAIYRPSMYDESNNTWSQVDYGGADEWPGWSYIDSFIVANEDFESHDSTQLYSKRQEDGSLPNIAFLRPSTGSILIDAGVDVGLPYKGSAPDVGYAEYSVPVTGITVTGAGGSTSITTDGGTLQLAAAVTPANAGDKTVTWTITNVTGVATISPTGLVSALANGTVIARATANDGSGVFGELQLTLSNQSFILVSDITVTGAGGLSSINTNNGTLQLSAAVSPGNAYDPSVTWSLVSGASHATISSSGLVSAVSDGTVTARATANDGSGVYGELSITISNQIVFVESITVSGAGGVSSITTDKGTLQLNAVIAPANATNKNFTWSIEFGTGEATISATGLVTAESNGTIIARATANDGSGVFGQILITISNQVIPVENHPPDIGDQSFDVYESNPQEDFIGTVLAYDSDAGQSLSFTIEAGNELDLFSIESNTGNLYFSSLPVDFYGTSQFELQVSVTDNGEGELSDIAQISINLFPLANVYYIDPDNSQDGAMDGSIEHPYDSWEKVNWDDDAVYLQKRATSSVEEGAIEITASNIILGAYGSGDKPEVVLNSNEYAIHAANESNITIRDMKILAENALSCLNFVGDQSDNIRVEHCDIESPQYAIRVIIGGSAYISKNVITSSTNGLFLIANFTEIDYNNFSANQQAVNLKTSKGDARIFNNVFFDNSKGIIADSAQTLIYNNIFYFTSSSDCAIEHTLTNCYSDYNVYYPEQSGFMRLSGISYSGIDELNQLTTLDLSSLVEDPLLKNRFQNNFEILDGSPAIDAGIYIGPLEDIYGTKVPVGKAPDIGSYEKQLVLSDNSDMTFTETEDGILVYPNPATEYLIIENQKSNSAFRRIEILDFSGRLLFREELDSFTTGSRTQLQLNSLLKGIYWLKIIFNNGNHAIKKILIN